jgi:hypothetical protein
MGITADAVTHMAYAKLAVISNELTGKIKQPIMMMDGSNSEFEAWMKDHGVLVLHPQHSFLDECREHANVFATPTMGGKGIGHMMRLIIPDILYDLRAKGLISTDLNTDLVLYTDTDIIFYRPFHLDDTFIYPSFMAHAMQGSALNRYHFNSGVSIINVKNMKQVISEVLEHAVQRYTQNTQLKGYDQALLHAYLPFSPRVGPVCNITSTLLPKHYNWEPYLGPNQNATIIHWHGPKMNLNGNCTQQYSDPSRAFHLILNQLQSHIKYHSLFDFPQAREGYTWAFGMLHAFNMRLCAQSGNF